MLDDLSVPDPEEADGGVTALARGLDDVAMHGHQVALTITRFGVTLNWRNCSKYASIPAFRPATPSGMWAVLVVLGADVRVEAVRSLSTKSSSMNAVTSYLLYTVNHCCHAVSVG